MDHHYISILRICSSIMVVGFTTTYAISTYHHNSRYRSFGMITVLIWKKACINLFITYFNIELKRTKINFTHTHTHQTMSDWYRLRNDNSPNMEKGMHCSMYKEAWHHAIRVLPRYLPLGWYRCGTSEFTYGQNWHYYL